MNKYQINVEMQDAEIGRVGETGCWRGIFGPKRRMYACHVVYVVYNWNGTNFLISFSV